MPKIEKTKSGKWHTRVYLGKDADGKMLFKSITADTKAKVMALAADCEIKKATTPKFAEIRTVGDAVDKYISLKKRTQSESGIYQKRAIRRTAFKELMNMNIADLTDEIVQQEIDKECDVVAMGKTSKIAPSTLNVRWELVRCSLRSICKLNFNVSLPQTKPKLITIDDIQPLKDALIGSPVELPCRLALEMGLRKGEILGLEYKHIKGDKLLIEQVVSIDQNGSHVIKPFPKNASSIRLLEMSENIKRLIKETDAYKERDGLLFKYTEQKLYYQYDKVLQRAGMDLTFHDLRHIWATIMIRLGFPLKLVQIWGGWSNPNTLLKIYVGVMEDERADAIRKRDEYFKK